MLLRHLLAPRTLKLKAKLPSTMEFAVEKLDPLDHDALEDLRPWQHPSWDLREEVAREQAQLWIARPAAHAPPVARALIWTVADEVHLLDLGTHPDWRRRGAARQVLNQLTEELRPSRILLEVRSTNLPALTLYRSLGFQMTRARRNYYPDGDDALEMTLELSEHA